MKQLDAVNVMLQAIGLTSVSSIDGSEHPGVLDAVATLNRIDKKVQAKGWFFNTDYELTLSNNPVTNEIILPSTTLSANPTDTTLPYVQRGTRLYDTFNATFEIGESVDVTLVQQLVFENLPEQAADYILDVAKLEFVTDKTGDRTKIEKISLDIKTSFSGLSSEDIKIKDIKLTDNPSTVALFSGITPAY